MKKFIETLSKMEVKMSFGTVALILLIAFLVALIIYFTYRNTYSGVLYNPRFNVSLVMITMVTTIVMVVIGSNISVSLGMVGALSIIRFRTAVKDPRDTAFIFWAVVSGLACGTQNYTIVIVGSLFVCLILFIFKRTVSFMNKYVLIVKGNNIEIESVEGILNKNLKGFVCKGKYLDEGKEELIYDIRFRRDINNKVLKEIKKISGVKTVNIISSNTDTMG